MDLTQFYTWASLLLSLIVCKLSQCAATPTYYGLDSYERYDNDRYDNDRYYSNPASSYSLTYGKPLTEDRLKRLNPGYYYVDDGYIAPVYGNSVANKRVQEAYTDGAQPNNVRYTPIVRYKQTRTKRKKLFVPNFFG